MVNYIIVEDERPAYEELKRMISGLRPEYKLTGWACTIEQARILMSSELPDLIFMDIHLADGLAFEIFIEGEEYEIPIIFTTAYNEYALDAFRAGGIDYLLKPVVDEELERSLRRFERGMIKSFSKAGLQKRDRFTVRVGDSYIHISIENVAYFHSEDKCTFVTLFSGQAYIIESTLDSLEAQLDERRFFRVSRSCLINISAIGKCTKLFGGRLRLHLRLEKEKEFTVSRGRVSAFLAWLDGIS